MDAFGAEGNGEFVLINLISTKELTSLINLDVDVVSFYKYEAHITLGNGNRLSFSCPFSFFGSTEDSSGVISNFPLLESKLLRVLGFQITMISLNADGTIEMEFSNGDHLILFSNNHQYENYSLFVDGVEYFEESK